jgi:predicted metal-dependent phosphoesterase TrpH
MRRRGRSLVALAGFLLGTACHAQEMKVFFGNLHSHTKYSDGSGTPRVAYALAKQRGLDFLAITDHNHSLCEDGATADRKDGILIATDHGLYKGGPESTIDVADEINGAGGFVALYGQEYSSIKKGNHVNVFDISEVIDEREAPNTKFDKLLDFLATRPASNGKHALIQFNHPFFRRADHFELEYGRDDFGGSDAAWVRKMGEHARTIEVLNGPGTTSPAPGSGVVGVRPDEVAEQQYLKFLMLGFHLAPTGDQDNHYLNNVATETEARTGIIADQLTKEKVLDAIDARHVYATEDRNLRVIFRVNDHLCGDRVSAPPLNSDLQVRFSIQDDDEPDADYRIDVFSGVIGSGPAQIVETVDVHGNTPDGKVEDLAYTGGPQYLFFRVTQSLEGQEGTRDDLAWTAPIWFDLDHEPTPPGEDVINPPTPEGAPPRAPVAIAQLVASKNSGSFHLSMECLDAQRIKPSNLLRGAAAREGRTLHPGCPRKSN